MATINGKTLQEIMQELKKEIKGEVKELYNKKPYFDIDTIRARFDEVVGPDHYNEKYSELNYINAKNSYTVVVKGSIELLDDDYNVILVKEGTGGSNINFPTDKENKNVLDTTDSIPNCYNSACQDAYKRICKTAFGIGKAQLDEYEQNQKKEKAKCFTLISDLRITGSGIFADGVDENGNTVGIAVFDNGKEAFEKFYKNAKKGDKILVGGNAGEYKGKPQYKVTEAFELTSDEAKKTKPQSEEAEKTKSQIDVKKGSFTSCSLILDKNGKKGVECISDGKKVTVYFPEKSITDEVSELLDEFQYDIDVEFNMEYYIREGIYVFRKLAA